MCSCRPPPHLVRSTVARAQDDDLDLFGDLTPEEQAAKEEKEKVVAAAKARAAEKGKRACPIAS